MNLQSLCMRGFTVHTNTELMFAPTGLVLVTGENGAGKSTIIEGVSVALWGKTLRGADLWANADGSVDAATHDALFVTRAKGRGKTTLEFTHGAGAMTLYETTTKAQSALESIVGPWDVWRRSSVFSSADAAHFSLASDGERKRLLESILDLDKFDAALDKCRVDRRAVEKLETSAIARLSSAESLHKHVGGLLADAIERANHVAPESPETLAKLQEKRARCDASVVQLETQIQSLRERVFERSTAERIAGVERTNAKKHLALLEQGNCSLCGQGIPSNLVEAQRDTFADTDERYTQATREHAALKLDYEDLLAELTDELLATRTRARDANSAVVTLAAEANERRHAFENASHTRTQYDALTQCLAHARESLRGIQSRLAELASVERALGMRGVRGHVLGQALAGVESIANVWLSKLSNSELRVSLSATTQRADGSGAKDTLQLSVEGAGGGKGYAASSGGERRRIDVALVLALGEVAAAAHGTTPGTLFIDELFDALDDDGCERAASAIQQLAETRCVVVVTHNTTLSRMLKPRVAWHVEGGSVSKVKGK